MSTRRTSRDCPHDSRRVLEVTNIEGGHGDLRKSKMVELIENRMWRKVDDPSRRTEKSRLLLRFQIRQQILVRTINVSVSSLQLLVVTMQDHRGRGGRRTSEQRRVVARHLLTTRVYSQIPKGLRTADPERLPIDSHANPEFRKRAKFASAFFDTNSIQSSKC